MRDEIALQCNECPENLRYGEIDNEPGCELNWLDLGDDGVLCPKCKKEKGPFLHFCNECGTKMRHCDDYACQWCPKCDDFGTGGCPAGINCPGYPSDEQSDICRRSSQNVR